MEKSVKNLTEFEHEAAGFAVALAPRSAGATLVTLSGELGAGKTAFTKVAARALGVEETVTSPTFVLEKIYRLPLEQKFKRLVHIDAYRLESGAELAPLGFNEIMKDPGNLIFLEWPEKVADALPNANYSISLELMPDDSRLIRFSGIRSPHRA